MIITTTIDVTDEMIENLIINSFEAGSVHWAEIEARPKPNIKWNPTGYASQILWGDVEVAIFDREGDEGQEPLGILNMNSIRKGLQVMADKYPKHFTDLIAENDDADTADVFLQLAIMGELVYG